MKNLYLIFCFFFICTGSLFSQVVGNCGAPTGGPGCSDPDCQAAICAADSFCCNTSWDQICANAAIANAAGGGVCSDNPLPPPVPLPGGDICADAATISCGTAISGTTVGATSESIPTCFTTNGTGGAVWYTFSSTLGGAVTLSMCGSSYDTKIRVWSGSCGSLACVAGNDDFCGLQSQVSFTAAPSTDYFVLVHGFASSQGSYTLAFTGDPDVCAAVNPVIAGCPGATTELDADASCLGNINVDLTITSIPPVTVTADNGFSVSNTGDVYSISRADLPLGITSCTVTADNGSGTETCTFDVNVSDVTPAVQGAPCPPDVLTEVAQTATWVEPSFADNCDGTGLTGTRTDATGIVNGSTVFAATGSFTISYEYQDQAGNAPPASCSFNIDVAEAIIPTMSEWGLILFGLIIFTLSVVFGTQQRRRMALSTSAGNMSSSVSGKTPFNKALFFKALPFVYLGFALIFALATLFGYQMTNADIPGSLLAGPIIAYLAQFVMGSSKEGK